MTEPYPENVDGDFYVEKDCCTLCDVPMIEARGLFTYATDNEGPTHCYVSKQPTDDSELEAMLSAIRCAEFRCIHYRGDDPSLLQRLVDTGDSDTCDAILERPSCSPVRPWWRFW